MDECRFCRVNEDEYSYLIEDPIDLGRLGEPMIFIDIHEGELCCLLDDGGSGVLFDKKLKINYCPMCGRKLD